MIHQRDHILKQNIRYFGLKIKKHIGVPQDSCLLSPLRPLTLFTFPKI